MSRVGSDKTAFKRKNAKGSPIKSKLKHSLFLKKQMPKSSKYKTSNKSAIYKRGYPLTLQIMTWLKYDEISKQATSHSAKFAGFLKIKTIAKTSPTRKAVPALKAKFQNKRRPLNKK